MDIFAEEPEESKDKALSVHVNNITKRDIIKVADNTVQQVLDGERDALEVIIQAKAIAQVAEKIIEGAKAHAIDEAYKYDRNDRVYHGVKFVIKKVADTWGFDHCDEWLDLEEKIRSLSLAKKRLEKKMVNAYNGVPEFFENGLPVPPARIAEYKGETIEIQIPSK